MATTSIPLSKAILNTFLPIRPNPFIAIFLDFPHVWFRFLVKGVHRQLVYFERNISRMPDVVNAHLLGVGGGIQDELVTRINPVKKA